MNMNDDYLWDRTGERDPEIEELERVMGTLRYPAPPLEIPAGVGVERARRTTTRLMVSPRWAVAAAIAVVVLGLGVWLSMQKRSTPGLAKTDKPSPNRSAGPETAKAGPAVQSSEDDSTIVAKKSEPRPPDTNRQSRNLVARSGRRHVVASSTTQLTARQLEDAQASKAQLMLALRVASTKVNFALKKTQTPNPANQQNQHRIG